MDDDEQPRSYLETFEGCLYFRYAAKDDRTHTGVALCVGYSNAKLVFLNGAREQVIPLGIPDLREHACAILDAADAMDKASHTTPNEGKGMPGSWLCRRDAPTPMPAPELRRLVGAMLDAADALEILPRTNRLKQRNPDT